MGAFIAINLPETINRIRDFLRTNIMALPIISTSIRLDKTTVNALERICTTPCFTKSCTVEVDVNIDYHKLTYLVKFSNHQAKILNSFCSINEPAIVAKFKKFDETLWQRCMIDQHYIGEQLLLFLNLRTTSYHKYIQSFS